MGASFAALFGAMIGGVLSVLASWIAQRVQAKSQWLVQEIQQRQHLYSQFVKAASRCFADALQQNEPQSKALGKLYAEMGRMRLVSSERVVHEATNIAHRILETYAGKNRSRDEVRDLLAQDSIDLFSSFSRACRAELHGLQPLRVHRKST